jgi:hypothetical protein
MRRTKRPSARGLWRAYVLADGTPVAVQSIPDRDGTLDMNTVVGVIHLTPSGADSVQEQLREAPELLPILRRGDLSAGPYASGSCPPERRQEMDRLNREWAEQCRHEHFYVPPKPTEREELEAASLRGMERRMGSSTPDD